MLLFAALKLAVVESRLPSNTVHVGPPSYQIAIIHEPTTLFDSNFYDYLVK